MTTNPQAMRAVSKAAAFNGHPDLGANVDPDTWLTPKWILQQLGEFDLDPCAAKENIKWTGARFYFSKTSDGLSAESVWSGRVFCNPPFSNSVPWIRRCAQHGFGITLVPSTTESGVWRDCVWPRAKAILLMAGRVRFCNPDGSQTTGRPLRPVALIAWSVFDADLLRNSQLAGVLLENWVQR